jgi:ubiquinone biosynthesis protein UbiJ
VRGVGVSGDIDQAEALANILPQSRADDALATLARDVATRDVDRAAAIVDTIADHRRRASTFVTIADYVTADNSSVLLAKAIQADHWAKTIAPLTKSDPNNLVDVIDTFIHLNATRQTPGPSRP